MTHALFSVGFAILFCIQITSIKMQSVRIRSESEYKIRRKCLGKDMVAMCGSNGSKIILFRNKCNMEQENRHNPNNIAFKEVAIGFCIKNCDLVCSTVYNPICAIDISKRTKRNFNNHCEMVRDRCLTNTTWAYYKNGSCIVGANEEIDSFKTENRKIKRSSIKSTASCTKIYNPVCAALYGVKSTFINECSVYAENKKTGRDWHIFSHGVCAEDSALAIQIKSKTNDVNNVHEFYTPKREKNTSNYNKQKKISPENQEIHNKIQSDYIKNKPNVLEQQSVETYDIVEDILQERENDVPLTIAVPAYMELNGQLQPYYKINKNQLLIDPTKQRVSINKRIRIGDSKTIVPITQASTSHISLKTEQFPKTSNAFISHMMPLVLQDNSNTPQIWAKHSTNTAVKIVTPNIDRTKLITMINQLPSVDAIREERATVGNILPYPEEISIGRKFERIGTGILNHNRFKERNTRFEETISNSNTDNGKNRLAAQIRQGLLDPAHNIHSPENAFNKGVVLETFQGNNVHAIANIREPLEFDAELAEISAEHQPTLKKRLYYTIKDHSIPILMKDYKIQDYQTKGTATHTNVLQNPVIDVSKFHNLDRHFPKSTSRPRNLHTHTLKMQFDSNIEKENSNTPFQEAYIHNPIKTSNINYNHEISRPAAKALNTLQAKKVEISKPITILNNGSEIPSPLFEQQLRSFNDHNSINIPQKSAHWEPPSKHFSFPYFEQAKTCTIGTESICAMFGSRMRNFNNYCEMLHRKNHYKEDWIFLHEGKCQLACNDIHCPMTYAPMCVSWNGLKYTIFNECHYRVARCQDQLSDWKILTNGECQIEHERIFDNDDEIIRSSTKSLIRVTTVPPSPRNAVPKDPVIKNIFPLITMNIKKPDKTARICTNKFVLNARHQTKWPIMRIASQKPTADSIIPTTIGYKTLEATTPASITTRKSSDHKHEHRLVENTTKKSLSTFTQTTFEPTTLVFTTIKPTVPSSTLQNKHVVDSHISVLSSRPSIYGPHLSSYIMRLIMASKKKKIE